MPSSKKTSSSRRKTRSSTRVSSRSIKELDQQMTAPNKIASQKDTAVSATLTDSVATDTLATKDIGSILNDSNKKFSQSAKPLLMLPMRLEYKVLNVSGKKNSIIKTAEVKTANSTTKKSTTKTASRQSTENLSKLSQNYVLKQSPLIETEIAINEKQIWFRWFPDDAFARGGIAELSSDEQTALDTFTSVVDSNEGQWFDTNHATIMEAWQVFANQVGLHRAIFIMRNYQGGWKDTSNKLGKILALPEKVALFGLVGGFPYLLAEGKTIDSDVRYTPKSLEPEQWLTNFNTAVAQGMGVKLTTHAEVANALNSQWIVAIGLQAGDSIDELKKSLKDAIANGQFSYVEQDTPTNNSEAETTSYESNPKQLIKALQSATYYETKSDTDTDTDADELTAMLGIDDDIALQADNASLTGRKNAEAMARCLLPALLSSLYEWPEITGYDTDDLISFIANYAYARGPLPTVRFKQNPYGILPVCRESSLAIPNNASDAEAGVFTFMQQTAYSHFEANADKLSDIPVIEPNDPEVADKLVEILQLYAVSRRTDIAELTEPDSAPRELACPLVRGNSHRPADYLNDLRTKNIDDLQDPTYQDKSWPLLYRVLRYSLSLVKDTFEPLRDTGLTTITRSKRSAKVSQKSSRKVVADTQQTTRGINLPFSNISEAQFKSALSHLETLSVSELEVLMMEVFDLMYYRADAWATGLAYFRLKKLREKRAKGLHMGYYGFLSRLREESTTANTDGYIQAPGLSQTITAGVLRSAALRFGEDNAFNINLSSKRVRKALNILDLLRQSLTLPEVLGHRTERWLHDTENDALIALFREIYPLYYSASSNKKRANTFDGLALAEDSGNSFSSIDSSLRSAAAQARLQAQNELDALSDLVTAEAVHQLTNGNSGAANAWMQVLSGGAVPSRVSFIRTQRDGQGSTHRVAYVMEDMAASSETTNPRIIAEPALAQLASNYLENFNLCNIQAAVYSSTTNMESPTVTKVISLSEDLGLSPVDLVIGGQNEIRVRARHYITTLWRNDEELISQLGPLPDSNISAFINQTHPLTLDWDYGETKASQLLEQANIVRRMINQARPIQASDMNAGAAPKDALTETQQIAYCLEGVNILKERATTLEAQLHNAEGSLQSAFAAVEYQALEIARLQETEVSASDIESEYEKLATVRLDLDKALHTISQFSLPEALRAIATVELVANITTYGETISGLLDKLSKKAEKISTALSLIESEYSTLETIEYVSKEIIAAIQYSTDGDSQAVWPPFTKNHSTTPLVDDADDMTAHLDMWKNIRPVLNPLVKYLAADTTAHGWFTKTEATGLGEKQENNTEKNSLERTEEERPRSYYHGLYIGQANGPLSDNIKQAVCGFVIDEWSEFKPSAIQNTGLAINYDTPQNEAPHTMILAVPESNDLQEWTEETAANFVGEVIRLMQHRALPSTATSFDKSGGWIYDVLPHKAKDNGKTEKRIPTKNYTRVEVTPGTLQATLENVGNITSQIHTANNLNERKTSTKK